MDSKKSESNRIFDNLSLGKIYKTLDAIETEKDYNIGHKDNKLSNSKTNEVSSKNDEYPAMDGLIVPCHLNNPERTVGNGKGSTYANKSIIKDASFLKRSSSMNYDSDLNALIAAVMSDSQLDFNQKNQLITALKSQSPTTISIIKNNLGSLFGAGIGLAIAKFLFGAGFGGQVFGSLIGAYMGNNLQDRLNNNSRIDKNPFSSSYNPSFINNPF